MGRSHCSPLLRAIFLHCCAWRSFTFVFACPCLPLVPNTMPRQKMRKFHPFVSRFVQLKQPLYSNFGCLNPGTLDSIEACAQNRARRAPFYRWCFSVLFVAAGVFLSHSLSAAPPVYIQGKYAMPTTAQTTVTVPYKAAQTPGDLNVVIVGWNDTTAQVSSVTDTKGNVYQLAVGPTQLSGALSQ